MSVDRPEIKLTLNAVEYSDWQSYELENSLLNVPSVFSFTAVNKDASKTDTFRGGGYCQIIIDDSPQLWGWIDNVDLSADESGARVSVSGRDIFSFLSDTSAEPKTYRKKTLFEIAQLISQDYVFEWSMSSITAADLPMIKSGGVKVEPGDNPLQVIQDWANKYKVIVWCEPDGSGMIGRPNYNQEPLYNLYRYSRSGDKFINNNIISGGARIGFDERYSSVTVYGTAAKEPFSFSDGPNRFKATASDTNATATRPLILNSSDVKNRREAQNMADLEIERRRFDSEVLNYTVAGHYGKRPDGKGGITQTLWRINTLVDVEDEYSGAKGRYVIVRRRFIGDENGRYTDLELRPAGVWMA